MSSGLDAPPLTLREYQREAVDAVLVALARGEHPVVGLPTGSGKAIIIAALCAALPGRLLVATHRKELLSQNREELARLDGDVDAGIYSAGLARRDTEARVIFGGIASLYRRMADLEAAGKFTTIIVDENHLCPPPSTPSMYASVFRHCAGAQRVGLSATPYRLNEGPVYGTDNCWFTTLCYHKGIQALTDQGYLAPLVGVRTATELDTTGVHTRQGEFVTAELSQLACEEQAVEGALNELCRVGASRNSWIVFCVDVAHTTLVTERLRARGIDAAMVTGETPADEREQLFADMRSGQLRALTNCMVASTGVNIPRVDLIALLRPSLSKSLIIQQIGRGSRLFPAKDSCVVLDFAANLSRHKPLDGIDNSHRTQERADKEAREAQARERQRTARHGIHASDEDPFGDAPTRQWYQVRAVKYSLALSRNPAYAGRAMLRVDYLCPDKTPRKWVAQWLCVEYTGWARTQAALWFTRRHLTMPRTATAALDLVADRTTCPWPVAIQVEPQGKYDRIVLESFPGDANDAEHL